MKNRRQPYEETTEETTEIRRLGLQLFYDLRVKLYCFMIHHRFKTYDMHISGSASRLSNLPPLPWTAHHTLHTCWWRVWRTTFDDRGNIPFAFLQWWFIVTWYVSRDSWAGCSGGSRLQQRREILPLPSHSPLSPLPSLLSFSSPSPTCPLLFPFFFPSPPLPMPSLPLEVRPLKSGGKTFNYFSENQLTKLMHFKQ